MCDAEQDEWVLILTCWPNDHRGFARPALERFDNREKAMEIRAEYASNDGLDISTDYRVCRRSNIESLPYDVSFDDCNDRFVNAGSKNAGGAEDAE